MGIIKNVFNDPFLTDTNQPQDRAIRRENRMINFWVKKGPDDTEGLPRSVGEKLKRVLLVCLGIAIAAAIIIIGIYMVRSFGKLGETGNFFS